MLERLFGDVNPKQEDYLKDIHSSGTHLLALINDGLFAISAFALRSRPPPRSR